MPEEWRRAMVKTVAKKSTKIKLGPALHAAAA
jgi:hypothetical protein